MPYTSNANLPHSKEHSCKSIREAPHPGKPDKGHHTDGFKKLSCSLSHMKETENKVSFRVSSKQKLNLNIMLMKIQQTSTPIC